MATKLEPPPGVDLTATCQRIADECGVSRSVAHRWKIQAGIPMRRGGGGVQRANIGLWGKLARTDWEMGHSHVAKLMGVSRQSVQQMWKRLTQQGCDLPKLKRGRPRKTRIPPDHQRSL